MALALVGVCLLAVGCTNSKRYSARATTSTTPTTTTVKVRPMVEGALKGLLLDAEQINAAMGATEMGVTRNRIAMSDDADTMEPRECLAVDGAAQAQVYAGSGFTAIRDLTLQESGDFTHYAEQAVVLFPFAKHARAFFDASAKQWPECHRYSHIQSGSEWTTSAITNSDGVLSTTATQENGPPEGWGCGRALAARNNVVIDVNTCSADPADTAVTIVTQIAGKIAAP